MTCACVGDELACFSLLILVQLLSRLLLYFSLLLVCVCLCSSSVLRIVCCLSHGL